MPPGTCGQPSSPQLLTSPSLLSVTVVVQGGFSYTRGLTLGSGCVWMCDLKQGRGFPLYLACTRHDGISACLPFLTSLSHTSEPEVKVSLSSAFPIVRQRAACFPEARATSAIKR